MKKNKEYKLYDLYKYPELWNDTIKIYDDSFPEWEKEPEELILERVKTQRYKMVSFVSEEKVYGFYILDIKSDLNFTLFSFLAVEGKYRGKGIGTILCQEAIVYFKNNLNINWLLIEAEDRQAKFYGSKFGFKKILMEYNVPEFDSEESVPMHLMIIEKEKRIQADNLKSIIFDVFTDGYCLLKNDQRIKNQLDAIPSRLETITWPKEGL